MDKQITKKIPKEITIKPEVRFGKPTVANTRVAVADILNMLKAGYTVNDIPNQYPGVTIANTVSAIEYAANILGKEEILAISQWIKYV